MSVATSTGETLHERMHAMGLHGYVCEHKGAIYIPAIGALHEGRGDCGRFLDSLPTDRTIVVPNVLSERLVGMLVRRGYVPFSEWAPEFGEWVECWRRDP
jgi:hypothetical protein